MGRVRRGMEGFCDHYGAMYGDRWEGLLGSLRGEARPVGVRVEPDGSLSLLPDAPEGVYRMDIASLEPALALDLPEAGEVLDACAAPGGKTLVLAARIGDSEVRIVANEYSSDRRRRLSGVLDVQLPKALRARVVVSGEDAAAMCRNNLDRFEAILLDAPCSSERHVLGSARAMLEWTGARCRNLALRQWSLLSSAFLMLKPGGSLVYSTCSISETENDGVVGRLSKKYGGLFDFIPVAGDSSHGEPTLLGRIILPDASSGAGPIYWAKIRKLAP